MARNTWCRNAVLLLLLTPVVRAHAQEPDVEELVRGVDSMYRSQSSIGDVSMTITRPGHENTLEMQMWTRGLRETFIRVTAPSKIEGMATLKLETELWNYLPKIDKVTKVSTSMMLGSWMGSDFTNDDLVKESSFVKDYTYRRVEGAPDGKIVIQLDPKPDAPIAWGKLLMTLDAASRLVERTEYYEESGKKTRELGFTDVRDLGGRRLPTHLTMVPLDKEGHRTELVYKTLKFDVEIPEDIFTLANLKSSR